MMKKFKTILTIFFVLNFSNVLNAENDFFEKGEKKYNEKKYEDSKFLFQRTIVFSPKEAKAYLYLAKIYDFEKNKKEKEKNINSVLLLDPKNEEAMFMLMEVEIEKSNYLKVRKLTETFSKICKSLCKKRNFILESLENLDPKNES